MNAPCLPARAPRDFGIRAHVPDDAGMAPCAEQDPRKVLEIPEERVAAALGAVRSGFVVMAQIAPVMPAEICQTWQVRLSEKPSAEGPWFVTAR